MGNPIGNLVGGLVADRISNRNRGSEATDLTRESNELQRQKYERERQLIDPALDAALDRYNNTGEVDAALYEALANSGFNTIEDLAAYRQEVGRKRELGGRGLDILEGTEGFDPLTSGQRYTDAYKDAARGLIDDVHSQSDLQRRDQAARAAFSGVGTSDISNRQVAAIEEGRADAIGRIGVDAFEFGQRNAEAERQRQLELSDAYRGAGREGLRDVADTHRLQSDVTKDLAAAPYLGEREYLNTVRGQHPSAPRFDTSGIRVDEAIDAQRRADRANRIGGLISGGFGNKGGYATKAAAFKKHTTTRRS